MNEIVTIQKLKQDEERFLNEIIASEGCNLPATIPECLEISCYTKHKVNAIRVMINAAKDIKEESVISQRLLEDGQMVAKAHLYSEAKLGEMLSKREKPKTIRGKIENGTVKVDIKGETLKEIGISGDQSHESQIIAKASQDGILEEVIEKAKQENDMPTKNAVITAYKKKQSEKFTATANDNKPKDVPPSINEALHKMSETIIGIRAKAEKMEEYIDHLNPLIVKAVVRDCKKIIDIMEGVL